jgi:multidrug efflux pump subunit AcrA (membrane-fusion protein)
MRLRSIFLVMILTAVSAAAGTAVFLTRELWQTWLPSPRQATEAGDGHEHGHSHDHGDSVEISPQARANLGLKVEPIKLETYWRVLRLPGVVVERRGKSDRSVTAPIGGVIKHVLVLPGESVAPSAPLLVLRPNSESLQNSQTELFKAVEELRSQAERYQIASKDSEGVIPRARLLELKGQLDRLEGIRKAQRIDLATRGLTPEQIGDVEKGNFLKEVTILASMIPDSSARKTSPDAVLELEELRVQVGEQVQAGQLLCLLSNHVDLAIEGHGFKDDAPLLAQATENGWPITVEVASATGGPWKTLEIDFVIQYMANTLDASSQTFPFYLPLPNQSREYRRDGKSYRVWKHRPGQRVRLGVRVEKLQNVFILPAEAVVRNGPEAYVFRQNGDALDRKPVHVLHEDATHVVIQNDGSVTEGNYIAQNSAAALNRVLKAKEEGGGGHDHGHDDGHSH